jgi:polysaccharide export outer membrane protein
MKVKTVFLSVAVCVSCISLSGCFHSNPEDISAFVKPYMVNVTTENYILQPPDEVEIHCSKVPEINLQKQRIRPDGKISFETLGEFEAAGKTCSQLADQLQEKVMLLYALTNENPVDVRITAYQSKSFYVLGQVWYPGAKDYTGRDTVLTALATAKITNLAWKDKIQVIRPSADPEVKAKIFAFNLDRVQQKGDVSKDVLLQEGDIIYVPPTILASIGLILEEFLRPIGRAFSAVSITPAVR